MDPAAAAAATPARPWLGPGVTAAAEQTVFLIVGGGVTVGRDLPDLLDRALDRRTCRDGIEPTRHIWVILPLHALSVVVSGPREGCDVFFNDTATTEIGHLAETLFQQI